MEKPGIFDKVVSDAKRRIKDVQTGDRETVGLGNELASRAKMTRDALGAPASDDKPAAAADAGEKMDSGARYGDKPGEKRIDTKEMTRPLGSYKKGTNYVPKTGNYKLHEGEAVVPKEQNTGDKVATPFDMITGGKKAPKTIQKHEYHKTHNGKHVVTHKHHDPSHKDEQHMFEKFSDAADHMEQNPPQPEPEAPEAAPAAGGAPAAGASPAGM